MSAWHIEIMMTFELSLLLQGAIFIHMSLIFFLLAILSTKSIMAPAIYLSMKSSTLPAIHLLTKFLFLPAKRSTNFYGILTFLSAFPGKLDCSGQFKDFDNTESGLFSFNDVFAVIFFWFFPHLKITKIFLLTF